MRKPHSFSVAGVFTLLVIGLLASCASPNRDTVEGASGAPSAEAPATPPNTDIFLADMALVDGLPTLTALRAAVSREGYDNQPSFLPGGTSFLFSSEGSTGKTDIWRQDVASKAREQITMTSDQSEYSPRLSPDGVSLSYIQESPDGTVTELHKRSLTDGNGQPAITLAPLGYYAWLEGGAKVAVFLRSEPASLHLVDVETGDAVLLAEDIGRGLYSAGDNAGVFFTTRRKDDGFLVSQYRAEDGEIEPLFPLVGTSEDYAVFALADGAFGFLCADGPVLYFRTVSDQWQEVADFTDTGIGGISRLAVNDDLSMVALVTTQ